MSNSPLVSYTHISPHCYGTRTRRLERITPHCVVGQCSVETLGAVFATSRQASSNYGIGADGRIALIVPENKIAMTSSSYDNDSKAVTIECASNTYDPYWMNDKVIKSLIALCVDICKRNGKKKLLWMGSKETTLAYTPKDDELVLSAHRWFKNKSCPGDFLYAKFGWLAQEVTRQLGNKEEVVVDKKGEVEMQCTYQIDGKSTVYWFDGQKIHRLKHPDELKVIQMIYKANNDKSMPHFKWTSKAPYYMRLEEAIKAGEK